MARRQPFSFELSNERQKNINSFAFSLGPPVAVETLYGADGPRSFLVRNFVDLPAKVCVRSVQETEEVVLRWGLVVIPGGTVPAMNQPVVGEG